jgi:polar amino acid transport system substrate-binding protein
MARRRWLALPAALLLAATAACSSSTTPERAKAGDTLRDGVLSVGTSAPFAPMVFAGNDGQMIGFDAEVLREVGKDLGLTVEFTQTPFPQLLPGILERKYDVAARGIFATAEREEKYTMVTYASAGTQWARLADSDVDQNDGCGRTVGAELGTTQFTTELPAKSDACTDDDAEPIQIVGFANIDEAAQALRDKRIDAISADSPVIGWLAKQSKGAIDTAGDPFDTKPYAFAVIHRAIAAGLLQQSVQRLIDDGRMRSIAEKWGMDDGLITTSEIRGKNDGGGQR